MKTRPLGGILPLFFQSNLLLNVSLSPGSVHLYSKMDGYQRFD